MRKNGALKMINVFSIFNTTLEHQTLSYNWVCHTYVKNGSVEHLGVYSAVAYLNRNVLCINLIHIKNLLLANLLWKDAAIHTVPIVLTIAFS